MQSTFCISPEPAFRCLQNCFALPHYTTGWLGAHVCDLGVVGRHCPCTHKCCPCRILSSPVHMEMLCRVKSLDFSPHKRGTSLPSWPTCTGFCLPGFEEDILIVSEGKMAPFTHDFRKAQQRMPAIPVNIHSMNFTWQATGRVGGIQGSETTLEPQTGGGEGNMFAN